MPSRKVPGRGRLDLRAEPGLIDVADQAARRLGMNISSYIRLAIAERLQRDGFSLPLGGSTDSPSASPDQPRATRSQSTGQRRNAHGRRARSK
jgi:hypothetical protein